MSKRQYRLDCHSRSRFRLLKGKKIEGNDVLVSSRNYYSAVTGSGSLLLLRRL